MCEAKRSLVSASDEAHKVSGCETTSALHRAQPRFSHEAKGKAPIGAISEAVVASLTAAKTLSHKVRVEAPSSANSKDISLEKKALSAHITLPSSEAILTTPPARRKTSKAKFKTKPKIFQPIRANLQRPRVSVLDQLGPANIDLQEFLSNKRKSHPEE